MLLALIVTFPSFGQKVKFNKGRAASKHYYTEITYRELKGKLIIPVTIDGATYRFLFDTGAPNLVNHDLLSKIAYKSINSIEVKDANETGRPLNVVSIAVLNIGDVEFRNSPAIVNDPESEFLFKCLGLDGIIGSNLIRNSVVHLDSRQQKLIITDQRDLLPIQREDFLDMALSNGQSSPYIWIELNGDDKAKEQVLIDTGAQGFYDLAERRFKEFESYKVFHKVEKSFGYKGLGMFGLSNPMMHHRVLIPEISIHGNSFKNVVSVSTGAVSSRIGSDLLQYGRVTLDYKDNRFYFESYDGEIDLGETLWDISPTVNGSDLVVGLVWSEELSKRIQFGDEILSIDGLDLSEFKVCDFLLKESLWERDNSLRLMVKDSTETIQEINLEKRSWE